MVDVFGNPVAGTHNIRQAYFAGLFQKDQRPKMYSFQLYMMASSIGAIIIYRYKITQEQVSLQSPLTQQHLAYRE